MRFDTELSNPNTIYIGVGIAPHRTACSDLRVVYRGVSDARPEVSEGAATRVGGVGVSLRFIGPRHELIPKTKATRATPWLCATTVPLLAFSCASLGAQEPPWEGCRAASKIEYESAKRDFLLQTSVGAVEPSRSQMARARRILRATPSRRHTSRRKNPLLRR